MVLKIWQAHDTFDPALLMRKFEDGGAFDWNDLGQLVRRTETVDRQTISAACVRGYRFLLDLTEDERQLANDQYQKERALWERLRNDLGQ